MEDARQPTAAERVRTLVESSVTGALTIPGTEGPEPGPLDRGGPEARAVTPDGDIVVLLPAASPTALHIARTTALPRTDDATAVMELTDVAPVSAPHRIRGRAWVAGRLTVIGDEERADCARLLAEQQPERPEDPADDVVRVPVRLAVHEAYVDDLWGERHVGPAEFAAAVADPFVHHEAELLQHLAAAHEEQVRNLSVLLGSREALYGPDAHAVPLALDRHGIRVRFVAAGARDRCFDARFEFPEPVADVTGLRQAMHRLFEAAAEEAAARHERPRRTGHDGLGNDV